ncbi:MAG: purine-nucleoside phosphorylase [Gemmatimonadota bacterium]
MAERGDGAVREPHRAGGAPGADGGGDSAPDANEAGDGAPSGAPDIPAAARILAARIPDRPRVLAILGSGLGHLADDLDDPVAIPFAELPGFPASGVVGHAGRYLYGRLNGQPVLFQAGRYHVYEGYPEEVVVAPVRLAAALGVEILIVTNAAGGADPRLEPGDLVLLDDHINLMFRSPLAGPAREGEERFPDMSAPYDRELQRVAMEVALKAGEPLVRGTYAAVTGPSYETAAEVRMLRGLGADTVGMSTVPEVITARGLGLRCLGFSMVTNKATGYTHEPLGHEEVVEVGRRAGIRLGRILSGVLAALGEAHSTGAK